MSIIYIFLWMIVLVYLFHLTNLLFKMTNVIDTLHQQIENEQEPQQVQQQQNNNTTQQHAHNNNPNPNTFILTDAMIQSIQQLQAGHSSDSDEETDDNTCIICTEALHRQNANANASTSSSTITLTSCGHMFHTNCIQQWMNTSERPTCPVCRHSLQQYLPTTTRRRRQRGTRQRLDLQQLFDGNSDVQTITLDGIITEDQVQSLGELLNEFFG